MSGMNRFNMLNMSEDSDEEDIKIVENLEDKVKENTEIKIAGEDEENNEVPDISVYENGVFFDRKPTSKEIYMSNSECFKYPNNTNIYQEYAIESLKFITPSMIEEFQTEPLTMKPIDHKQFYSCDDNCCNQNDSCYNCDENGKHPELFIKAWRRLTGLIERITNEIPVENLDIKHAFDFTQFFQQIEGQRCEKFKKHDLITGECGFVASLHTWLSFNTDMKTFNKRTQRNENLKLFIGTYDKLQTGHDLCTNWDYIDEINRKMAVYRRDYLALKTMVQSPRVTNLTIITERKMRKVYSNYLILLSKRFKFFIDFDSARVYIKNHYSRIKENKEQNYNKKQEPYSSINA